MMRKVGRLCPSEDELAPFFAALYSGVCKVNAAIAAQTLIDACGVDALVVSGVAGGLDAAARPIDLVIARGVSRRGGGHIDRVSPVDGIDLVSIGCGAACPRGSGGRDNRRARSLPC